MSNIYDAPIPEYGDVMPVSEFKDAVHAGVFIDYDGHGYPAQDGVMNRDIKILPSTVANIPEDATHIIWFNR